MMWRWLHSLPRVIRHQWSGSGASAGIHVDDLNERSDIKHSDQYADDWKCHCKQRTEDKNKKHGSGPDTHDFWRMIHGPYTHLDAIRMGGVVALGIQMGHFKCLHKQHKFPEETRKHCLLSTIVLHALPPDSQPKTRRNVVKKHDSVKYNSSTDDRLLEPVPEVDEVQAEHSEKKPADCESLEDAFQNFQKVCKTYTAVGKGIMGSQEALQGNLKSAAALWEEAGNLGNAKSRFNLAVCYETGRGVKKNLKEAVRLYKLAAEDLHPQAMFNLGLMYVQGTPHTPRDTHKGLQLVSAAADFGLAEAQCYLGVYYTGERTENSKKAVHYLSLAATQKNAEAQYCLALCYQHGYGVEENMCKASSLYSKAADSGHPDAMFSLATFHQQGLGGIPKDVCYGYRLMERAAAAGCTDAKIEIQHAQKTNNNVTTEIHSSTADSPVKKQQSAEKESNNVTYQFKLNNSVSSPCLTDLLREDLVLSNKDLYCDPVSDMGTLSKLYTQLMSPRGLTLAPTVSKIPVTRTSSPKLFRSDFGIVFGPDIHEECSGTSDELASSHRSLTCSGLHRRTSTMPDLNAITCL